MLKNLLETWAKLAPDECEQHYNYLGYIETTPIEGSFTICSSTSFEVHLKDSDDEETEDRIQGYIQRCIEYRDGWEWMVVSGRNPEGHKVYDATVWVGREGFLTEDKPTPLEALLGAYIIALESVGEGNL